MMGFAGKNGRDRKDSHEGISKWGFVYVKKTGK